MLIHQTNFVPEACKATINVEVLNLTELIRKTEWKAVKEDRLKMAKQLLFITMLSLTLAENLRIQIKTACQHYKKIKSRDKINVDQREISSSLKRLTIFFQFLWVFSEDKV